MAAGRTVNLLKLPRSRTPAALRPETYFDFKAHPFAHSAFLLKAGNLAGAVQGIGAYAQGWLEKFLAGGAGRRRATVWQAPLSLTCCAVGRFRVVIEPGATFLPSALTGSDTTPHTLYVARNAQVRGDVRLESGSVYIGAGTILERGAVGKGPTIVGRNNEIRAGAYLRGNLVIGDGGIFRGEMKNSVVMDKAMFPHACFVGDSICGFMSHFGQGAVAANFGILEGMKPISRQKNVTVRLDRVIYDLGSPKFGLVLGDYSQVGCNAVTDPGTFLAPGTVVYPLTRLPKGFYGPRVVIKNKPMEHGILETAQLRTED